MAESIFKLRVDSSEYDQKIKRASDAIKNYADDCRKAGGTLEYLDDGVLDFVKALGQMDTVANTTKGQMREMSQALADMTMTYRALSDQEKQSPFGQALSQSIQQLTERAGNVKDAMIDVEQSIKNASSDTRLFDQLAGGASMLTNSFQTLQGATKLLGIDMGDNVEVIAQLQAAMAVTNGLTQIQNALQSQSAVMQGVQAVQAAAAAVAQGSLATATGAATIAQKAFNAVATANPYVLLATAIVGVGAALYAFSSAASEAKQKEEELAKAEEEAQKKADESRQSFVNASAEAMNSASRLSSLQVAYKKANTEIEKTGILKQAQSEFNKLGISCKNVHDAQTLLIQKGAQVIELIKTQGNVAALSAIRMEKFKESFKMLMENGYSASAAASLAGYNKDVQELDGQINKMQSRIQGLKGSLGTGGSGSGKGGKTTKQEDTNYAADSIMAQEKEVQRLTDQWNRASAAMREGILKDLDAAKAKLDAMKNENKPVEGGQIGEVTVKGSKMASVNKEFREAPINLDSINTYIGGVKDAMKNADIGSDMWERLTEKLKDATTMSTLLQELMERGLEGADLEAQAQILKDKLLSPEGIDQEAVQKWLEGLSQGIEEAGGIGMALNPQTGEVSDKKEEGKESDSDKEYKKFETKANQFISGLSSVASGLKGLGVEIPESVSSIIGVIQSVMQVIQGVQTVVTVFSTSAIAANTAAITANTMALYAKAFVPFFKNGGIVPHAAGGMLVPGNDYSDNTPVMVSSGELILNKAQQGNIASQLQDSGSQASPSQPYINGEMIYLGLQSYTRRSGLGEIVTAEK